VLAERLPGLEHDQQRSRAVVLVDDDRVARSARRSDREQIPVLHGAHLFRTRLAAMALVVDRIVLNAQYGANCYVVRRERGAPEAAVIDPGGDPAPLRLELAHMYARAAGILVTHTDVDHVAGVADLADGVGAEVWAPAGEADVLRRGETRGGLRVRAWDPQHEVTGGDQVTVAGITFDVVDVPGHSSGHVAYAADGKLFSGDLLFAGSVGRVDLEGGDWQTLLYSVQRLLDGHGREAVVYPGHGEPTTLGRELETNPFLAELRAASQ
jgi:glyoxylase-like metal-dependent hydrolase (beta-lactamase superfamily II)